MRRCGHSSTRVSQELDRGDGEQGRTAWNETDDLMRLGAASPLYSHLRFTSGLTAAQRKAQDNERSRFGTRITAG
jgi:hypothetical protein